ncbi:MAG TPA: exopolysaccharide transport family protein [Xanthobacteraceae bacterium]
MFEPRHQITPATIETIDPVRLAPIAGIDFQRIWSLLWRRKSTIAFTTIGALVAGLLLIVVVPHQYTATTQILIDPSNLRAVENELTPVNQMNDAAVLQLESQVRVLTSDNVLRRVIIAQRLDRDPEFGGTSVLRALANGVQAWLALSPPAGPTDQTLAALNELQRHLRVKRAEHTYVVEVAVSSEDREKAVRITNAIAQAYLAEHTAARSDAARRVSDSISARLSELKDRVREAEERAQAFKVRNHIVGASGQLVDEQQLHELNNQLGIAHARTEDAKARYAQVARLQRSKSEIGAFTEAIQSQTMAALRTQYAEIMRREAEQTSNLGARHPAVIEIAAQAQRLRRVIDEEINRIALSAHNDFESAQANEDALSGNLETLKRTNMTTNEALVTLRELDRDVQASRAIYESFLVRAKETGEQERLDTNNIRVISTADLPLRRSWPPSNTMVALAALFLGLAAGTGTVLLRAGGEGTAPRDAGEQGADPHQQAGAAAFPVLAVLPPIERPRPPRVLADPKSRFALEMRKLHDAVRSGRTRRAGSSVLVVASHDEDDATSVALNLASVAAATQRVLLIDADLQRRTLSALIPDRTAGGLVDVAVGRKTLADVVIHDSASNINLLPFVSASSLRRGKTSHAAIKAAFEQTRQFDMVIVAARNFDRDPSAAFFAALVDHIVPVARAGAAGKIDQVIATLGIDARHVRGTVLNGAEAA